MADILATAGAINWTAALAVPGALDLVMDGMAVTDETPAAFEDAYARHIGRWSLAGVSDEQLEGLARAGIELTRLASGTDGEKKVRFRELLQGIAGELRKVHDCLPAQPNGKENGHAQLNLNHIHDVLASVQQTLGEVEKNLQELRGRKLGNAKDRFRRLLMRKVALRELERDLLLLEAWITRKAVFNIEPLARRILSSSPFRQLKGETALLREKLASLLRTRSTDVGETRDIRPAILFAAESLRYGYPQGQDTAYSPD